MLNRKNLNTRFVPFAVVVIYPPGAYSDIVRTRMLEVEKVKMMRSRAAAVPAPTLLGIDYLAPQNVYPRLLSY